VQAGGVKRKRGTSPGESKKTRPGVLVPLTTMRLADIDTKVIAAWLDKETKQAPTTAAQAFRALRAFLTWCAKHKTYIAAVQSGVCQSDDVKNRVPSPKIKRDDSLRKAQIKPWFEAVQKIGNPVIAAYLQGLLLTGARRNELAAMKWQDVDFQWKSLSIRDKVEGERTIPLTPYLEHLIAALPRRNEFVLAAPPPHQEGLKSRAFSTSKHWPQPHSPRCPCTACAVPLAHYLNGWKSLPESSRRLWDTNQARLLKSITSSGNSTCCTYGTSKLKRGYWSRPGLSLCRCKPVCV
jgi:hypothetical protein